MANIRLTESEKLTIILCRENKSYGKIADIINRPRTTIHSFYKRFKERHSLINKKQKGAVIKITKRKLKMLATMIKRKPHITRAEIRQKLEINVHLNTISKYIKSLGISRYNVQIKAKIKGVNKRKRVEFCSKYLNKTMNFWKNVNFCDESSFSLGHLYRRKIWRKRGVPIYDTAPKRFSLKYVKVWMCIGYDGVIGACVVNTPFNSNEYIRILKENYINQESKKLIQDLDTTHFSQKTRKYMNENNIRSIEDYPPESPDINLVENLWFLIKKKVYSSPRPETIKQLIEKIFKEINYIPLNTLKSLYLSIPKRLMLIKDCKGEIIKY